VLNGRQHLLFIVRVFYLLHPGNSFFVQDFDRVKAQVVFTANCAWQPMSSTKKYEEKKADRDALDQSCQYPTSGE